MSDPVRVAVPRKGRPLEAVLALVADCGDVDPDVVDEVISVLRYEKAVAKGDRDSDRGPYERLATYSDTTDPAAPEFTLLRDDRPGFPRRLVFDSLTVPCAGRPLHLVGREEPFRALRKHEVALGFDAADLVLEEVVTLEPEPLARIEDLNDRIDPRDTDVRVVGGLGDTVHHTLLATPAALESADASTLSRDFVADYEGAVCISPRYERLVEAVLGTSNLDGVSFSYPTGDGPEEAAIAETGVGVYITETGSTARDHGLRVGERLFPSETVLLENAAESRRGVSAVVDALVGTDGTEPIPVR